MLGKLFKYEFKNTAKIMLTIYVVLAAITAFGMIVLSFDSVRNGETMVSGLILIALILLYVLSIFTFFIITYVYMTVHFYKTMYSSQGYLTHTLPVNPMATFNVKLVTAFVWMLLTTLLCALSIFGILGAALGSEFREALAGLNLADLENFFHMNFGMSFGNAVLIGILSLITSCLASLLLVFTSCSIGQLFNQYKVAAAVIAGIIFYLLQQVISTVAGFVSVMGTVDEMIRIETDSITTVNNFTRLEVWLGLGISLLFIAVYYITSAIIVQKHINLE